MNIVKECKESQDSWEASEIRGSVHGKLFPITITENQVLEDRGLTTVSQILSIEEPRALNRLVALELPGNLPVKINNMATNK